MNDLVDHIRARVQWPHVRPKLKDSLRLDPRRDADGLAQIWPARVIVRVRALQPQELFVCQWTQGHRWFARGFEHLLVNNDVMASDTHGRAQLPCSPSA